MDFNCDRLNFGENGMKKNLVYLLTSISLAVFGVFTALNYSALPADMPMQIGLTGQANWTLPKPLAVSAMAGLLIAVSAQFILHFRKQDVAGLKESLVVILLPLLLTGFIWFASTLS
jgi:uncharacterized membrane protein